MGLAIWSPGKQGTETDTEDMTLRYSSREGRGRRGRCLCAGAERPTRPRPADTELSARTPAWSLLLPVSPGPRTEAEPYPLILTNFHQECVCVRVHACTHVPT